MGRVDSHNKGLDILSTRIAELSPDDRPALTIQGPDWGDRAALKAQSERLGLSYCVRFPDADFKTQLRRSSPATICSASSRASKALAWLPWRRCSPAGWSSSPTSPASPRTFAPAAAGWSSPPIVRSVREGLAELAAPSTTMENDGTRRPRICLGQSPLGEDCRRHLKEYRRLTTRAETRSPAATSVAVL